MKSRTQEDGTLKFLPIDGSYQITANGKMKYFSVIALKNGEAAKLQDDGTGAIWAIGTGIGKPSVALSEVGWTPENGLCMPQLTAKKYQLTFIAGVTMKVDDINFKFFHINGTTASLRVMLFLQRVNWLKSHRTETWDWKKVRSSKEEVFTGLQLM